MEADETVLGAGMVAAFPDDYPWSDRNGMEGIYLEIGDRAPNDQVHYPKNLHAKAGLTGLQFGDRDDCPQTE